MAKNVASTHSSASALTTAWVVGHGPSSKVRTTSLSRRKSCCLKCSRPNPGPPVVSISTTRATPSASGFLQVKLDGPEGLAPPDVWGGSERKDGGGARKAVDDEAGIDGAPKIG